jgi:glycopeptide antibiotics resistance protein
MDQQVNNRKKILVVVIAVSVALLHFVTGDDYNGPFPVFVNGYMIDLLLPLSAYFLLCMVEAPLFQSWMVKSAIIFGFGLSVEIAQYFGFHLLGSTYDPLDILMYALGVLLAAFLDKVVFPRFFSFWEPQAQSPE